MGENISFFFFFHSQTAVKTLTTVDVTFCLSSFAASVVNGAGNEAALLY